MTDTLKQEASLRDAAQLFEAWELLLDNAKRLEAQANADSYPASPRVRSKLAAAKQHRESASAVARIATLLQAKPAKSPTANDLGARVPSGEPTPYTRERIEKLFTEYTGLMDGGEGDFELARDNFWYAIDSLVSAARAGMADSGAMFSLGYSKATLASDFRKMADECATEPARVAAYLRELADNVDRQLERRDTLRRLRPRGEK